jgi:preprotein translocase subunit SecG
MTHLVQRPVRQFLLQHDQGGGGSADARQSTDIMDRAATATKVLMDFMVVFLKSFVLGVVALM